MYNSNEFKKGTQIGSLDLTVGGISPAFTVRLDPNYSGDDVEAGTVMMWFDGGASDANGVPLVTPVTAAANLPVGARLFSTKSGVTKPGEIMQVSSQGCVQVLTAGAAINRGAEVSWLSLASPGKVTLKTSTFARLGIAIDKASADGDVIRVLINPVKA